MLRTAPVELPSMKFLPLECWIIKSGDAEVFPNLSLVSSAKNKELLLWSNVISLPDVAPLNNTSSANVERPVMLRFLPVISSYTISPTTFKSPPIVTIPAKAAFPLTAIVDWVPTWTPSEEILTTCDPPVIFE